jgi:signal transduction histidine kinase
MNDPWGAGPGRRTRGAEGFQPHGGPAWSGPPWGGGGRRLRRGGLVALLVLALLVAGLATLITSLVSGSAPPAGITIAVAALVLLGVFLLLRWFWRSARSIGAVVDASERVATGDLAARVGDVPARPLQQLASSFDQMTSRLETDEARRRELLADIAHELRTPLQAIRGTVDGMLDGLYPVDEEHLRPIVERTEVMARLLDDLRTLSTVEAGVLALHREPVDPRGLAQDAIAATRADADATGVRLEATTAAGVPTTVDVDPVRITEVLTNLVENAIQHSPDGGLVSIALTADGRTGLRFDVTDQGHGIPQDQVAHVFERFVTSADRGGTGLGLAIARRLVEAHGGTLVVASSSPTGTTMRVDVPI